MNKPPDNMIPMPVIRPPGKADHTLAALQAIDQILRNSGEISFVVRKTLLPDGTYRVSVEM